MDLPDSNEAAGADASRLSFLDGCGRIGSLLQINAPHDSPLGSPAGWPTCLKNLMTTILPAQVQIVVFWGPQYVALYNDAYAPTIGDKHPSALGRPAVEHWGELWDDLEPLLQGVRETGQTYSAKDRPFYIERSGLGETVYFDISYSAVREADGSIGGVMCIVAETTERVQFERRQAFLVELGQTLPSISDPALIESHVLNGLRAELQTLQISFVQIDDDGASLKARTEAGSFTQVELQEVIWSDLRAGTPVFYGAACNSTFAPATPITHHLVDEPICVFHIPVISHGKLEAILTIEPSTTRTFGDNELYLAQEAAKQAWLWISHARAELALRSSSAQLSAMFEQASAGIAVCDEHWHFETLNDRYCDIVGRTREELLRLHLPDIAVLNGRQMGPPGSDIGIESGIPFETTLRYQRPDGSSVWVEHHVTPLLDEHGQSAKVLCVCVDISERIRAESRLRDLNESLEQRVVTMLAQREKALAQLHESRKMEMVGQLSGGVAHDFNNLLTPIIASLELVRRRVDDERSTRLIDGALLAADRARTLVGRLLTFARRQTLQPEAIGLEHLVSDLTDLIARSLGPMISVDIRIPESLPAVFVDPHQLELAILNLAVNARDAIDEDGRVTITANAEHITAPGAAGLSVGRYVRLLVRDNGCGMDHETLKHCVDPFYSTKGVGKGTGLGLSMVQGLALQSGGGFDIRSKPGMGTEVTVWLPVAAGPVAQPEQKPGETPALVGSRHVLLVDDDDLVRNTTALVLRDLGYTVTQAASAAAALQMFDAGLRPDILVTDYVMADKTGVQLSQQLRQRVNDLPILIITGYANISPTQTADFEILAKPFRREDIAARLANMVCASH
jgi:PAS domain S-box-containing protein